MANTENEMSKREMRRKRRIKSQIIAYISLVVVLVIVLIGAVFGIKGAVDMVKTKAEQREADRLAQESETLVDEEVPATADIAQEQSSEVEEIEDPLDDMVDELIAEMSVEEKAASVFMIYPEDITGVDIVVQAGEGTKAALEQYSVGGLVYRAQNVKSSEQLREMIKNSNSYSKFPLFYGVSEESGSGTLAGIEALGIEDTATPQALAEAGDNNQIYSAYSSIGNYLSDLGINLNFAPIADVLTNEENDSLVGRTFGSDPTAAKEMIAFATDALQQKGVSATLMKFPGEGDLETGEDGVAVTNKSLAELKDTEFVTFQAGIDAGADIVMMSHICAPTVTGDTVPSSLSATMMQEVLRGQLGFEGIIMTDAMNQEVITSKYSSAEAAVAAINAGADMILEPENFEEAYQAVLAAIQDGSIGEERINDALHHILYIKYKGALDE